MGLSLVTAPAEEPVTLAEAKVQCRVDADITADDALITALIVAARERAEHDTGRALVTQTRRYTLDRFPCWGLKLPRPPLQSVESITYIDTVGAEQTLDAAEYRVITDRLTGLVAPVHGGEWPATRATENAVAVTYVAGYGAAAAVPQAIKQWILAAVATLYGQREALVMSSASEIPRSMWDSLLDAYRIYRVV